MSGKCDGLKHVFVSGLILALPQPLQPLLLPHRPLRCRPRRCRPARRRRLRRGRLARLCRPSLHAPTRSPGAAARCAVRHAHRRGAVGCGHIMFMVTPTTPFRLPPQPAAPSHPSTLHLAPSIPALRPRAQCAAPPSAARPQRRRRRRRRCAQGLDPAGYGLGSGDLVAHALRALWALRPGWGELRDWTHVETLAGQHTEQAPPSPPRRISAARFVVTLQPPREQPKGGRPETA
jgi:hypothetical protein